MPMLELRIPHCSVVEYIQKRLNLSSEVTNHLSQYSTQYESLGYSSCEKVGSITAVIFLQRVNREPNILSLAT